jgi:hypothetical protein
VNKEDMLWLDRIENELSRSRPAAEELAGKLNFQYGSTFNRASGDLTQTMTTFKVDLAGCNK